MGRFFLLTYSAEILLQSFRHVYFDIHIRATKDGEVTRELLSMPDNTRTINFASGRYYNHLQIFPKMHARLDISNVPIRSELWVKIWMARSG